MGRPGWIPIACGALAVLLTVATMIPSLRPAGWSLTVLPRVDSGTGMGDAARKIDPGFRTVHPGAYDGQFYWGIAVDPIATGDVHQYFDTARYRYGHPLYGWLGWLFSAGQARAAPYVLAVVSVVAMLLASVGASLLGRTTGREGWEGLFVAVNPGLLYAGAHTLAEPVCATLLVGGMLAYVRGRLPAALACFALLPLSKEPLILVPLAIAAWGLLRRRIRLHEAAFLAATALPAIVWWTYARIHLGSWFTSGESTTFSAPLGGWKRALLDAGVNSYSADGNQNQLGEATVIVLVALAGLLLIATLLALRLRGPLDAAFLPLAALMAFLGIAATANQRDILRVTSVLIVLVPFVIAAPAVLPVRRSGTERASRSPADHPER
jgi:hypothetical protein